MSIVLFFNYYSLYIYIEYLWSIHSKKEMVVYSNREMSIVRSHNSLWLLFTKIHSFKYHNSIGSLRFSFNERTDLHRFSVTWWQYFLRRFQSYPRFEDSFENLCSTDGQFGRSTSFNISRTKLRFSIGSKAHPFNFVDRWTIEVYFDLLFSFSLITWIFIVMTHVESPIINTHS